MDVRRYSREDELVLDVEFVTPAFLGGANSKKSELRASSFKGMLRFWWRALYGAQYGDKILEEENNIFGSASTNNNQASLVRLQVFNAPSAKDSEKLIKSTTSPLSYLAYGKGSTRSDPTFAKYLDTGSPFKISISFSAKLTKSQKEQAKQSLLALIEFGGIGGKCRNGYGCMKLCTSVPMDKYSLADNAKDFPTLSRQTKCFQTKEAYSSWTEALAELGNTYKLYKKSIRLTPLPGEKRHSKEMFLHVVQTDGKFKGFFLAMPLSKSRFSSFFENLEQSGKFDDITNTMFKV